MQPLAVTGLGVVSPVGVGRAAFEEALSAPTEAQARAFEPHTLPGEALEGARVASCGAFDASEYLGKKGLRNFDRLTKMAIVAAKLALEDSGLKRDGAFVGTSAEQVGVCAATAYGSLDSVTEINRVVELEHPRFMNPSRFPNTVINSAAGYVSIWEGLRGPNVTVVDGSCGALDALLDAATHLSEGRAEAFLVGGAEVISEALYLGLQKLGCAGRPGALPRGGVQLGEAAAFLAIEPTPRARARGARVCAELVGFGAAFEPPSAPGRLWSASATAVARAVRQALVDAAVDPAQVGLVCGDLRGLPAADAAELEGLRAALGGEAPVVAPKNLWGETFGAAGALAMTAAACWIGGAALAPWLGPGAPRSPGHVLVLSTGLYGSASAVVMRAPTGG